MKPLYALFGFLLLIGIQLNSLADPTAEQLYNSTCAACHALGVGGAPKVGDHKAWQDRINKDIGILYHNAIYGFSGDQGQMLPKGGFTDLEDEQIKSIVRYMIEASSAEPE